MEKNIFRFILRYSIRNQLVLILMSAAALPFLYLTLELPKIIVNEAIGGVDFPRLVLGYEFDQIPFLLLLCGLFLVLVIISGVLKFFTSTFRYRIGDRLLRRLRYDLIERLLRFPPSEFRNMPSGQVVSMITAETTSLGFFIAEAFAVPAIAFGTLATIVLFMFLQNWMMGVAAIALYPLQIYLIPKIQRKINRLQRGEVEAIRGISQRIGDVVAGVHEIHGHDTSQYELADFSQRLGTVFRFRVQIDRNRYTANILNQFISQLTPFLFLSIGGYLVIDKQISLGALVAVLAAYKDMYSPWKDLIDYYQKAEDSRVRYDHLKEFFARGDLLDKSMIEAEPASEDFSQASLVAENVVVEHEEGNRSVDGASIKLTLPTHAAILGSGGSGREEFARLLARQDFAHSGSVTLGDSDLAALPDSVTGRRIGFIGRQTFLRAGSIFDVLVYPLLRRPKSAADNDSILPTEFELERAESMRAGNSSYHAASDWIDYAAAGCRDENDLRSRMIEILRLVDLDLDVYKIGLRRAISPELFPKLVAKLLEARAVFRQRLHAAGQDPLIESFDADTYNTYATVAENVIFGTPVGPYFAIENLGHNDYMQQVIENNGLTTDFLEMGHKLAAIKAEIFQGLSPGHEFFERFSFINSVDMPAFKHILLSIESHGIDSLEDDDRHKLMTLPFKLVETKHQVGLIDKKMKRRLLKARRAFAKGLPGRLQGAVQFFQEGSYNAASSIVENIIFGKTASNKAGSTEQIGQMVSEIVDELNLREDIISVGLEYEIGVGGSRLSAAQHQKIALARCLIKRPDILIMNDAMSSLDFHLQEKILANIKTEFEGRSLILFESSEERRREFEKVLRMDRGRFVEDQGAASSSDGRKKPEQAMEASSSVEPRTVDLNEIATLLMDIPLFEDIDRSKLKLLAFTSERLHFDENQEVFHQGDRGSHAYVIVEGEADVVLESTADSTTVATLGRNEIFGEMALLSKMPRTTTIRAKTPLVLLSFSQDVFLRMVEENSEIASAMMRVLAERLAATLREYGEIMAEKEQSAD
jgi:ABC-type bacteriocin/lantibiotic exporter with double-glycine peptidase domain